MATERMLAKAETMRFPPRLRSRIRDGSDHFIVTGAGGWFGLATLEMLDEALGPTFDHRVTVYASADRTIALRSKRLVTLRDLTRLSEQQKPNGNVCIAHYAFLTREKVAGVGIASYIALNRDLTSFMEAEARRLCACGTFSTSSGAVYRKDGGLDDDLQANPYGVLKLEEEAAFARLRNRGTRTAICRVFNVSGPFLNKEYALDSLIRAAQSDTELIVRARHKVIRSYAHVRDIVSVGFAIMTGLIADVREPYDTAGLDIVEVGDLANRIRSLLRCLDKPIVRNPTIDGTDDRYVGCLKPFQDLAQSTGFALASLDDQILDTARYIASATTPIA